MQDVELSIVDILEHGGTQFASTPIWTLTRDGAKTTTFGEVRERATKLASALKALDVAVGDRVGTFAWNTSHHLECYLAIPSMGAIIHTINPRFSVDQVCWTVNDAGTSIIVVDESLLQACLAWLPTTPDVRTVIWYANDGDSAETASALRDIRARGIEVTEFDELLSDDVTTDTLVRLPERSAAAICYTSGTTGNPKGVVYSHRSIWLHSLLNTSGAQFALSSEDVILPAVPMFHVMAWNLPFSAFMVGSGLILTNRWNQASHLLRAISSLKPTFAAGVPTIWNDIIYEFEGHVDSGHDLDSLTRISSGGAVVPDALIGWWQARGVRVLHGCGMTESSGTMTSGIPPEGFPQSGASPSQSTQGRFLIGVRTRLVDEYGSELPKDGRAAGELQLAGPWITASYHGVGDSATTLDGWLPTGDIASITPEGLVRYTDRTKDVIKSGGEWISSVALEAHIANHPLVREAAVIAIPDARWQERPLAVIVTGANPPSEDDLKGHVGATFPRFWIPDRFVTVPQIPRTSVGKIDKKILRERYAVASPGHDSEKSATDR